MGLRYTGGAMMSDRAARGFEPGDVRGVVWTGLPSDALCEARRII